ncbi:MAG: cyclophilin-like fold protein [Candidatus Jordarchaeales archaeon]
MRAPDKFKVRFLIEGAGEAVGEIDRSKAPSTVDAFFNALPITSEVNVWQNKEVYFSVGINVGEENAKESVEVGEIAYWPMGDSLCVFYDKIRPYSEVNPVGRVVKGLEVFRSAKQGAKVKVELFKE